MSLSAFSDMDVADTPGISRPLESPPLLGADGVDGDDDGVAAASAAGRLGDDDEDYVPIAGDRESKRRRKGSENAESRWRFTRASLNEFLHQGK